MVKIFKQISVKSATYDLQEILVSLFYAHLPFKKLSQMFILVCSHEFSVYARMGLIQGGPNKSSPGERILFIYKLDTRIFLKKKMNKNSWNSGKILQCQCAAF